MVARNFNVTPHPTAFPRITKMWSPSARYLDTLVGIVRRPHRPEAEKLSATRTVFLLSTLAKIWSRIRLLIIAAGSLAIKVVAGISPPWRDNNDLPCNNYLSCRGTSFTFLR